MQFPGASVHQKCKVTFGILGRRSKNAVLFFCNVPVLTSIFVKKWTPDTKRSFRHTRGVYAHLPVDNCNFARITRKNEDILGHIFWTNRASVSLDFAGPKVPSISTFVSPFLTAAPFMGCEFVSKFVPEIYVLNALSRCKNTRQIQAPRPTNDHQKTKPDWLPTITSLSLFYFSSSCCFAMLVSDHHQNSPAWNCPTWAIQLITLVIVIGNY